jgi:hypothetical protein
MPSAEQHMGDVDAHDADEFFIVFEPDMPTARASQYG